MKQNEKKRREKLLLFYLDGLVKGKFTLREASESTGHSRQWLCKLKKRYLLEGAQCLVHGNTNHIPHNKTPDKLVKEILLIYGRPEYDGVNFATFRDALEEYHNIKVSYNTLHLIMDEAGIRSPEAHKIKKRDKVHRPRLRRECEGDLIQIDGTPFEWFSKSGDSNKYCMSGAIDDATGKLTAAYITENECLYGIMELLRMTKIKYGGVPREMYMDRAAWACVTPRLKNSLSITEQLAGIHEKRTQLQRIMYELNIRQILAWSPQAKGRVERMWQTIQGRYPIWAFHHGIKTVEDANKHMNEFIDYFNSKWAVQAARPQLHWQPAPDDFDDIVCAQFPHKTNVNGVFKFHSYQFAVVDCPFVANKHFTLCVTEHGLYAHMPDDKYYNVQLLDDITYGAKGTEEPMPDVVKNIIWQNLLSPAKEVSA